MRCRRTQFSVFREKPSLGFPFEFRPGNKVLFHSQKFLFFFLVVFAVYWLIMDRVSFLRPFKKRWLLVTSFLFYMSWNIPLVALMVISPSVDYFASHLVHRTGKARYLVLSLTVNLCILGYFKYANFMLDSVVNLLNGFGLSADPIFLNIILPLGISFYTFESMSYVIDVYMRRYPPYQTLGDFFLFVSFFPHLIAGPIIRADWFARQMKRHRRLTWPAFYHGCSRFAFGLFKKVVLASQAAPFADAMFANPGDHSGLMNLLGVYAFAFQIYFDFSAYTDMALGLAMLLGYQLPENFQHPYESASIREFWQRWHISLSTWLRDYLYIPLGGSHVSSLVTYRNLFIVFGLGGLWHGAGWNFFIWGVLHGAYLSIERMIRGQKFGRSKNWVSDTFQVVLTFHLVCFSWVFFRASSFEAAWQMLGQITHWEGFYNPAEFGLFKIQNWVTGMILPFAVLVITRFHKADKSLRSYPAPLSIAILTFMIVVTSLITAGANEFIYFQF